MVNVFGREAWVTQMVFFSPLTNKHHTLPHSILILFFSSRLLRVWHLITVCAALFPREDGIPGHGGPIRHLRTIHPLLFMLFSFC